MRRDTPNLMEKPSLPRNGGDHQDGRLAPVIAEGVLRARRHMEHIARRELDPSGFGLSQPFDLGGDREVVLRFRMAVQRG